MTLSLRTLLLLLIPLLALPAMAQYGPGGVGTTGGATGQPAMRAWFRADQAVTRSANTNRVTTWTDRSGHNYAATPYSDTTTHPKWVANVINSQPTVRFYGIPYGRLTASLGATLAGQAMTFFAVAKDAATSTTIGGIMTFDGYNGLYSSYDATSGTSKYAVDGNGGNPNNAGSTLGNANGAFQIVTGIYNSATSTNSSRAYMNGTEQRIQGATGGVAFNSSTQFELGGRTWGSPSPYPSRIFNGDIAEVIAYDSKLDSAQRIIVENYLAAKYNLTISDNKYAYATQGRNDVAGIGRANNGSQHLEASSSILTVKNPQTLANKRFMLYGHNGGALTVGTANTPNNDVNFVRRIPRQWRFNKTGGDLGTTSLVIDYSSLDASIPAGFTRGIFLDQDGNFTSGSTFIDLQPNTSTTWKVDNLNIPDGWYVTVGAVKRVVSFQTATASGFENVVQLPVITAVLNFPYAASSGQDVIINYSAAPCCANPAQGPGTDIGDRWETSRTQAVIPAGQSSVDLNQDAFEGDEALFILNDGDAQPTAVTVRLTLANITGASIGNTSTYTYYIYDDDYLRKISYQTPLPGTWNELDAGQYLDTALTVTLNTGQTGGPTYVDVVVTGAAKAGLDYTFPDSALTDSVFTVTIPAGKNKAKLRLRLLGNNVNQYNRTLILSLFNPESGTLSQTGTIVCNINIIDNDPLPTIYFSPATAKGSEGGAANVNAHVRLSQWSGKSITVPYTIGAGTATQGADWDVTTNSPLTLNPGDTAADIQLTITDDGVEEDDETILLNLGSPTNATLGSATTYTYTILDDDVYGSTGPGGVDRTDAQGNLELWLSADANVTVTSGQVSSWGDLSGHPTARNAAKISGYNAPTLVSNQANGRPVLRFGSTGTTMLGGSIVPSIPGSPLTIFSVFKDGGTTSAYGSIFATDRWAGFYSNGSTVFMDGFTTSPSFIYPDATNTSNTSTTAAQIQQYNVYSGLYTQNSTTNSYLYRNGNLEENFTGSGVRLDIHSNYRLGVRWPQNSGMIFKGDVGEMVMFSSNLNAARRIIVETYLGVKYGVSTAGSSRYTGNDAAYTYELAGIGTTDGTSANKHRVASSPGLTMRQLNNSLDAANEYVFFAHQAGVAVTSVGQVGASRSEIWSRVWYVAKTGGVDARFTFDYDAAGIVHTPIPENQYYLIYKSTPGGTYAKVAVTPTLVGNQVSFDVPSGSLVNGYYTLGRTDPDILPVVFASFTAYRKGGVAQLKWQTASEANSAYFSVERSADGKTFAEIGRVAAAGNSAAVVNYAFADSKPASTNLYRLRQVDRDGQYIYSQVRSVSFGLATAGFGTVKLYPNPATGAANLEVGGEEAGPCVIDLTDLQGRTLRVQSADLASGPVAIDLTGLTRGSYIVRCRMATGETHLKNLVVE